MSHTTDLIDKYKAKMGLETDYAAAKKLRIHPNRFSNYRCGVSHADDKMAIMLADALELDRLKTIALINADRAKDSTDRIFWKKIATAAALVLAIGFGHTTHAKNIFQEADLSPENRPFYTLCAVLKTYLRWLSAKVPIFKDLQTRYTDSAVCPALSR